MTSIGSPSAEMVKRPRLKAIWSRSGSAAASGAPATTLRWPNDVRTIIGVPVAGPGGRRPAAAAFMGYSMERAYGSREPVEKSRLVMVPFRLLVCVLGSLAAAAPAGAHPPRPRDQDVAFRGMRDGRFMPLRAIE